MAMAPTKSSSPNNKDTGRLLISLFAWLNYIKLAVANYCLSVHVILPTDFYLFGEVITYGDHLIKEQVELKGANQC